MMASRLEYSAVIYLCAVLYGIMAAESIVTLNHGGQLKGKSVSFNGRVVDLFLGVRYAEPPINDLRFRKPKSIPGWSGLVDATEPGRICPQVVNSTLVEDEDCLYLDITIPDGLKSQTSLPVMVWIHGGAFRTGSGSHYLAAPLALTGDVIVVSINYRLGMLGFLTDGPGTGNFGLWDQRQAIIWVKENIASFGGDPAKITIFGESAGSASVSAQMMGQHNTGLFQRAIQQSGTLYSEWGWFKSQRELRELNHKISERVGCDDSKTLYELLRDKTVEELIAIRKAVESEYDNPYLYLWHPTPDGDFFSSDIIKEDYEFPVKVDLMAGFNGQEGFLTLAILLSDVANKSVAYSGYPLDMARDAVDKFCRLLTPLTVNMCTDFLMKLYGIDSAQDNMDRAIKMIDMFGELSFGADTYRQLERHSMTDNSTFAYYLTEAYTAHPEYSFWEVPAWAKKSADHSDDLMFVFGGIYCKENFEEKVKDYYGTKRPEGEKTLSVICQGPTEKDRWLTDVMMTAWCNFAKSGNPNSPVTLPSDVPTWPVYDKQSSKFMELNSNQTRVITAPGKDRLDRLIRVIFEARTVQKLADK